MAMPWQNQWNNPDMQQQSMWPGVGQAGFGIGQLFGLGKGKNPADVANKRLNEIPGQTKQYYDPYMQAGQGALGDLQNQYKNLLGGNVQNQLGEGYKESPGYQFKLQQALGAGNNAAAAGGMAGSGAHQQGNMQVANDIASQDYNDYLQNQLGLYGMGLQGQQGLNQQGFNANTSYADMLANLAQQQGQYDYAGQASKNQNQQQAWKNIFGGLFGF